MRKSLLIIVTLLLVVLFVASAVCYADTASDGSYADTEAYLLVKEICEKFPKREAGVNAENPAENSIQEYLKNKLTEMSDGKIAVEYRRFQLESNVFGFNVVGKLNKSGSGKQIIIGAHYDSKGQGANDNAAGVAALLMIAKEFAAKQSSLPCNVVFVLFDAEERGLIGSQQYVNAMTAEERDNTLVMFNLDSIASGDNLYLWCENKHTDLADLIIGKSNQIMTEKPYAKGTFNIFDSFGYGYYEFVQNSDQTPFRLNGIPTAFMFSGTYDLDPWHYAENSDVSKQVMNSSNDTFENLVKNTDGKFVEKINAVVSTVTDSVLDGQFTAIAENQRNQLVNLNLWYNAWWAKLIAGGILVVLVICAVFYYRKLQKKAILGTAEIKDNKVFSTPEAEDIFTFK